MLLAQGLCGLCGATPTPFPTPVLQPRKAGGATLEGGRQEPWRGLALPPVWLPSSLQCPASLRLLCPWRALRVKHPGQRRHQVKALWTLHFSCCLSRHWPACGQRRFRTLLSKRAHLEAQQHPLPGVGCPPLVLFEQGSNPSGEVAWLSSPSGVPRNLRPSLAECVEAVGHTSRPRAFPDWSLLPRPLQ